MRDVITFNWKRKVILFIIQIIFIIIGLYMMFFPDFFFSIFINNKILIRIIGLLSFLLFFLYFIFSIKIYFRKVGLIIDHNGISDFATSISVGFISWAQIRGIQKFEEGELWAIKIYLNNVSEVLDNIHNPIIRFCLKRRCAKYGTPVVIPVIALNTYIDTLELLINTKFNDYRIKGTQD